MAEQILDDDDERPERSERDVKADLDERRIAKGVAIALPLATVGTAIVVALVLGPAISILVLAAGVLLGVIALFWASLRILSGDAPLPADLEALDTNAQGTDPLASRKLMLVRAIKDLENEHALGKLEDEDYEQLTSTYRAELKDVLRRIDATLEPYRVTAEQAARDYLVKAGVIETGYRGETAAAASSPKVSEHDAVTVPKLAVKSLISDDATSSAKTIVARVHEPRLECPKCQTSNEIDASFCKKCGQSLAEAAAAASEMRDEA